jgi:4-hydroxy-3-methylbut-2-enyl diphosphate reductase IspH
VTFGGLSWLQSQQHIDTIQSGTINPDATVEEVIEQIEHMTQVQVMSGAEFRPA